METIEERKQVPVAGSWDVIVAGAGVSGVFAAIASARKGASTLLIDRFGSPGGNIGPGLIAGGSLSGWPIPHMYGGPFFGIPREFIERHSELGGGSVPPYKKSHYLRDSNIATHVLLEMLEEDGVDMLLSTYACDPIIEGERVRGIFVENKSGRSAAMAGVLVDATGEVDILRRAGAPVIRPERAYNEIDQHAPTGMGIYFVLAGVRWSQYQEFRSTCPPPGREDLSWAEEVLGRTPPPYLVSRARRAWEDGEFRMVQEVEGLGRIGFHGTLKEVPGEEGLAGTMFNLKTRWIDAETQGRVDAGDGHQISLLEARLRMYIFELSRFWRKYVPGFEDSYLAYVAPFLGSRGGPCAEGDYVMTYQDLESGRRFPDVLYVFDHVGEGLKSSYRGKWTDLPYRVLLPRGLEGVLCVGRNASCRPDTLLRSRSMVMHMGEAGGYAAALSVDNNVTPRELDVKLLQETLLEAGYYLGDTGRLVELGLNSPAHR